MAGDAPMTRQQMLDLHAQLACHVGDLRQVEQLLRASLSLNDSSAVAPLLRQRIQLCGAAISLLSAPLVATPGQEAEEGAVLASIREFVEESVVMLREQKSLVEALTQPDVSAKLNAQCPTQQWQQRGVQVMPRAAALASAGAPQQAQPRPQPAMLPAMQAWQATPLGMQLLQQQPPGVIPPPGGAPPLQDPQAAGFSRELPFGQSIEMLPLMPSIGGDVPTLSQLIEGSFMSLSLKDDGGGGAGGVQAIVAAVLAGGSAGASLMLPPGPQQAAAAGPAPPQPQLAQPGGPAAAAGQQQPPLEPAFGQAAAAGAAPDGLAPLPSPVTSGSGSMSYRRVSLVTVPAARASSEEASPRTSGPPSLPGMPTRPFMRPPAAGPAGGAAPHFPARPPPTMLAGPPPPLARPPTSLAVVQAGTGVRIAQATAASLPADEAAEQQAEDKHAVVATAEGPVTFVAVEEAPPHDFSQGETSLAQLFFAVKETGVLPPPTIVEESEEGDGSGDQSSEGAGRSTARSAAGKQAAAKAKPAAKPAAAATPAEEVGTKRPRRSTRR